MRGEGREREKERRAEEREREEREKKKETREKERRGRGREREREDILKCTNHAAFYAELAMPVPFLILPSAAGVFCLRGICSPYNHSEKTTR